MIVNYIYDNLLLFDSQTNVPLRRYMHFTAQTVPSRPWLVVFVEFGCCLLYNRWSWHLAETEKQLQEQAYNKWVQHLTNSYSSKSK